MSPQIAKPAARVFLQATPEQDAHFAGGLPRKLRPVRFAPQHLGYHVRYGLSPNGLLPDRLSNKQQPKAQTSVRLSTSCPHACSGLI